MNWKHNLAIMLEIVVTLAHRQFLDRSAFTGQPSTESRHFTVGQGRIGEKLISKFEIEARKLCSQISIQMILFLTYRKHSSISSCNFRFPVASFIWYMARP